MSSRDTLNGGKLRGLHQRSLVGQTRDQLVDILSSGGDKFSADADVEVSVFSWKEDNSQNEEIIQIPLSDTPETGYIHVNNAE